MRKLFGADGYLSGLGMASLVQGIIALILSPLPVLGVPISLAALLWGVLGTIGALCGLGPSLRISVSGIGAALLALTMNLAIAYAPSGYGITPVVPHNWNPPPDRPNAPPPAPSHWFD